MNGEAESIQEFEAVFAKFKGLINLTDEVMIRLYKAFFDTGEVTLNKLEDAVMREDYEAMTLHAHSIKGNATSLCYDDISNLAQTIEEKAKLKESGEYTELLNELVAQFQTAQHNHMLWRGKRT